MYACLGKGQCDCKHSKSRAGVYLAKYSCLLRCIRVAVERTNQTDFLFSTVSKILLSRALYLSYS